MYAARTRARRAFALWYRVYRTREAAPSGKSGTAPVPAARGETRRAVFEKPCPDRPWGAGAVWGFFFSPPGPRRRAPPLPAPPPHGRSGQKTFAPALTAGRIMM